jgi:hypothetical protein
MTAEQVGRRWRERRVAQSRRDVELETFPTTSGSQALLAHPMFGAGRGQSPQAPTIPVPFPEGHTVHVRRASQTFASAGTKVEWTDVRSGPVQAGFPTIPGDLPTDELTIPADGYYDFHVQFEWDSHSTGGTVQALVGSTVVSEVSTTAFGSWFHYVFPLGVCERGDKVSIRVSPDV